MLKELNWQPLKDRRRDIRLALLFKIVKGKVAVEAEGILNPADSSDRGEHERKFRHLQPTIDAVKYSFFPRTIKEWNNLPLASTEADSVPAFLASLRTP